MKVAGMCKHRNSRLFRSNIHIQKFSLALLTEVWYCAYKAVLQAVAYRERNVKNHFRAKISFSRNWESMWEAAYVTPVGQALKPRMHVSRSRQCWHLFWWGVSTRCFLNLAGSPGIFEPSPALPPYERAGLLHISAAQLFLALQVQTFFTLKCNEICNYCHFLLICKIKESDVPCNAVYGPLIQNSHCFASKLELIVSCLLVIW